MGKPIFDFSDIFSGKRNFQNLEGTLICSNSQVSDKSSSLNSQFQKMITTILSGKIQLKKVEDLHVLLNPEYC